MSEPLETIHLYIVREGETEPIVESTANTASEDLTRTATQPLVTWPHPKYRFLVPFLVLAVNLSIVVTVFFIHIYPILTATATITIIPKSAVVTAHLTLSNIQSRIFQPITLTQSRTVAATGKGHQDATAATGTITLYNAATFEQTIDPGTLLIGSDGVHIVTDQTAVIEGATPPIEGQLTVSAHAVNKGAAGNIQAGDISGACCRENIFAYNSPFQGGADERNYTIVTQSDINSIVSSVMPHLTESMQTSFKKQIHSGEVLTPNQCSQKISTDHNAGDEATAVTVIVTESCLAGAYTSSDFQAKVQQALAQQAEQNIGKGYLISSYFPTSLIQVNIRQGTLVISGTFQGRMIYHFSSKELTFLRQQLAGKSRQQAIAMLSHLQGIARVYLQVRGTNEKLPINAANITFLFVEENMS